MENIKIEMKLKKSTKGTHVYEQIDFEDNSEMAVPSVYVRKSALPAVPPAHIFLTIEAI